LDEVDGAFAVIDGGFGEVDVFVVNPGVADGEDGSFADLGGEHDDVLAWTDAVVAGDGFLGVFVDDEEGGGGVFDSDGGDFLEVDFIEAGEDGVVGEVVAVAGEDGVWAVGGGWGGVAVVAVVGEAEAGGEIVEVFELASAGIIGEEEEHAAILDPFFDGGDGGFLDVVGFVVDGDFLGGGAADDIDGGFFEVVGGWGVVERGDLGAVLFPDVAEFGEAGVGGVAPDIVELFAVLFLMVEELIEGDDFSLAEGGVWSLGGGGAGEGGEGGEGEGGGGDAKRYPEHVRFLVLVMWLTGCAIGLKV